MYEVIRIESSLDTTVGYTVCGEVDKIVTRKGGLNCGPLKLS